MVFGITCPGFCPQHSCNLLHIFSNITLPMTWRRGHSLFWGCAKNWTQISHNASQSLVPCPRTIGTHMPTLQIRELHRSWVTRPRSHKNPEDSHCPGCCSSSHVHILIQSTKESKQELRKTFLPTTSNMAALPGCGHSPLSPINQDEEPGITSWPN